MRLSLGKLLDYRTPRKKGEGPVAWCKQCSRKHPRRKICDLYLRTRYVKQPDGSFRKVQRWAR